MKNKLSVGQTVRLCKINKVYATFTYAFKKMGFKDIERNPRNVFMLQEYKDTFFKIFSISTNNCKIPDLIGIENEEGVQILVETSGVTVIKKGNVYEFNDRL